MNCLRGIHALLAFGRNAICSSLGVFMNLHRSAAFMPHHRTTTSTLNEFHYLATSCVEAT